MEETVKQRLTKFIESKNITKNKFETQVGLSTGYLKNLKHQPKAPIIGKILQIYPELNQVWLLTGEGEMLNSDISPVAASEIVEVDENTHGVRFARTSNGMRIDVPLVPFAAMASPVDEFAELIQANGCERASFPVDGMHHGSYFAFRVEGDSMDDGTFNGFRPGDIVLVRELDRQDWAPKLHISKWPFWVICWDNCVRLKQIVGQTGDSITCHSLNPSPEYCDFTLPLEGVKRLFNVVQVQPKPRIF